MKYNATSAPTLPAQVFTSCAVLGRGFPCCCCMLGDMDGTACFFRDGVFTLLVRLVAAASERNAVWRTPCRNRFLLLPCIMLFCKSFMPVASLFTVVNRIWRAPRVWWRALVAS